MTEHFSTLMSLRPQAALRRSLRNCLNLGLLILMRSSIQRDVKVGAFANFLLDFVIDNKNSTSYEYKIKSAKSRAQFLPMGIPIHCRNK